MHRVLHESSNITAPYTEHLKFQEKNDFYTFALSKTWQNKINKIRIRVLYIQVALQKTQYTFF